MKFKLIDTALRETNKFPILVKISPDGTLAYVVYEIEATDKSDLVAELFDISNGKFDTLAVYVPENMKFPSISSGFVNPNFTLFSVVESNGKDSFRVRLLKRGTGDYSHMLVVTSEIVIDGIVGASLGGNFLSDGTSLVVTAVVEGSDDSHNSKIWILGTRSFGTGPSDKNFVHSTPNLKVLATRDVKGIIITNSVPIQNQDEIGFALCKSRGTVAKGHVHHSSGIGTLDFKNLTAKWQPKHKLVLYKFDQGQITKMDEEELPQGALSLESHLGSSQIVVGTSVAVVPGEISIKVNSNEHQASFGTDGKELRIYDTQDWLLNLQHSRGTNGNVEAAYITPNGEYLIISHNVSEYSDFGPSVLQVTDAGNFDLDSLSLGITLNGFVNVSVDDANTKMLVGTANDDKYANNNLLLYTLD